MNTRRDRGPATVERRRFPRYRIGMLDLMIDVRTTLSGDHVQARLVDVSLGGCCLALPGVQATLLQDNGACVCALPVGVAGYPLEYAAAVVARRGEDAALEHFVHLSFNHLSLHSSNLLARWIGEVAARARRAETRDRLCRRLLHPEQQDRTPLCALAHSV